MNLAISRMNQSIFRYTSSLAIMTALIVPFISGCATRSVVVASDSSFGFHATTSEGTRERVVLGYDRSELIYQPTQLTDGSSMPLFIDPHTRASRPCSYPNLTYLDVETTGLALANLGNISVRGRLFSGSAALKSGAQDTMAKSLDINRTALSDIREGSH